MSSAQTRVLEFAVDAGGDEELVEQHFVHAEYHSNGRGFDMLVEGSENGKMKVSGTYDATTGDVVAMMNGKRNCLSLLWTILFLVLIDL